MYVCSCALNTNFRCLVRLYSVLYEHHFELFNEIWIENGFTKLFPELLMMQMLQRTCAPCRRAVIRRAMPAAGCAYGTAGVTMPPQQQRHPHHHHHQLQQPPRRWSSSDATTKKIQGNTNRISGLSGWVCSTPQLRPTQVAIAGIGRTHASVQTGAPAASARRAAPLVQILC